MLKHIGEIKDKKSKEVLESFNTLLESKSPRIVSDNLKKSFELSPFFLHAWIAYLLVGVPILLIIIKKLSLFSFENNAIFIIMFALVNITPFMLALVFLPKKQICILQYGDVFQGKIESIDLSGTRINNHEFYLILVVFENLNGEIISAKDLVSSEIIEDFQKKLYSENDNFIDIIYFSKYPKKVILPMKLIKMARFAK